MLTWLARRVPPAIAAAGLAVFSLANPALASAGSANWRIEATISVAHKHVQLDGVSAVSRADAWTIGTVTTGVTIAPIILRWTGRTWQRMKLPRAVLTSVGTAGTEPVISASSASNAWAFDVLGRWAHWDGKRWHTGKLAPPSAGSSAPAVDATLALGKSDVWAFGSYLTFTSKDVPYAARFDGHKWHVTTVPGQRGIGQASALSASDIWAVDANEVVRWNGHIWQTQLMSFNAASGFFLASVVALSDTNVWAGGETPTAMLGQGETVAHLAGHTWSVTHLPHTNTSADFSMVSLASDGKNGIWGVGSRFATPQTWRLWHFSRGKWTIATPRIRGLSFLVGLSGDLAHVPGSTSTWGAGGIGPLSAERGMILLAGAVPH
jgi:hypothetical protein